ncbi:MAG TPA: hypothetical protein V6C72_04470, partial [Chroococcales cyanobacterium]
KPHHLDNPVNDPEQTKLNISTTYRLKAMALLRFLSEVALWVILIGIPPVLLVCGKFNGLPFAGKIVFSVMAAVALCLLPLYGFVTYQVKTDQAGISTHAFFIKQFCAWENVKALSRRSSWNWLRYVVEFEGGEISFPILLKNCDQLVEEVRAHLPTGAPSNNPFRTFTIDRASMLLQIAQALYGVIFIAITWGFFAALSHSKNSNMSDSALILIFCLAATGILLWRTYFVVLMPKKIQVQPDELVLATHFFERKIPWSSILSVKPPSPFLPEGFIIKTRTGTYLVGSHINASDELQETIKQRMSKS